MRGDEVKRVRAGGVSAPIASKTVSMASTAPASMGSGGALGGVQGMGSASIAAAAAADSEPVPRRSALPAGRRGPAMTKGAVLQRMIIAGIFELDCYLFIAFFFAACDALTPFFQRSVTMLMLRKKWWVTLPQLCCKNATVFRVVCYKPRVMIRDAIIRKYCRILSSLLQVQISG
jgi:hypothetical protein